MDFSVGLVTQGQVEAAGELADDQVGQGHRGDEQDLAGLLVDAATVSTVLTSSSGISPAASLASSCSTISACIFSLIFTLNMNTSRLSTIRSSGT